VALQIEVGTDLLDVEEAVAILKTSTICKGCRIWRRTIREGQVCAKDRHPVIQIIVDLRLEHLAAHQDKEAAVPLVDKEVLQAILNKEDHRQVGNPVSLDHKDRDRPDQCPKARAISSAAKNER